MLFSGYVIKKKEEDEYLVYDSRYPSFQEKGTVIFSYQEAEKMRLKAALFLECSWKDLDILEVAVVLRT